jgi:ribosome-binding protein aMBF1 (putative translation factor)
MTLFNDPERRVFAKRFGARIRQQRRALGVSQTKLAELMGVSLSCICSWESGRAVVDTYLSSRLKRVMRKLALEYFQRQIEERAA